MTAQGTTTRADALGAARREAVEAARVRARRRPPRSPGVVVRDVVITLAGIAGVLVILWTVLSRVLGLSLVVLMTGSMAPTLPTGSAAVTLDDVPAAELRVGDVVKVPRPGYELPVTHRIVAIGPVTGQVEELSEGVDPADPTARELVLRGDANDGVDPTPYVVTEADRVLVGAPYVGYANRLLHTPLVLIGLGGALVLLLVGTSWPTGRAHGRRAVGGGEPAADTREGRRARAAAVAAGAEAHAEADAVTGTAPAAPAASPSADPPALRPRDRSRSTARHAR